LQPNEEARTETHIVVSAGQDRALAIGSVHEIIALPPGFSAIRAAAAGPWRAALLRIRRRVEGDPATF
jgi:hypothetical protein